MTKEQLKAYADYIYRGRHNANHLGVLVRGTKGVIRFGGLSWGYFGQGCRGLQQLFNKLGITADASDIANWPDFSDKSIGEHWKININ